MKFLLIALLPALFPPFVRGVDGPEVRPPAAEEGEASAVRDRLASSLFFRGELADRIIEADMAKRFVDLDGIETNAGARSALLAWIQKNPARAARVCLTLERGGGRQYEAAGPREMGWEINPVFLAAIKDLNAAAADPSASGETLELAARRLYEGRPDGAPGLEAVAGGTGQGSAAAGSGGFFSINYADYRLDRAGLEREILQAGAWLKTARGAGEGAEVKSAYSAAFLQYSGFIVAASSLKNRGAVTEQESVSLEGRRVKLRMALAALVLRSRVSTLAAAAVSLERTGAKELSLSVSRTKAKLEARAARIEAGNSGLGELGRLVNLSENEFAALYLWYSAYDGLLSLGKRAAPAGFSCFYDYAVYRYLAAFFPGAAYPRARARLAAVSGELDAALRKAGEGDVSGALSGLEPERVKAAAGEVRFASSFNRSAQFFSWGLLFRPVEYKISVRGGRAVFRPVFTFFEITGKKRPPDGRGHGYGTRDF